MNDQNQQPHVSLTWTEAGPTMTVDGVDLTHVVLGGSVRIEVPSHAGTGQKPIIRFALAVDDFRVDGIGVDPAALCPICGKPKDQHDEGHLVTEVAR